MSWSLEPVLRVGVLVLGHSSTWLEHPRRLQEEAEAPRLWPRRHFASRPHPAALGAAPPAEATRGCPRHRPQMAGLRGNQRLGAAGHLRASGTAKLTSPHHALS